VLCVCAQEVLEDDRARNAKLVGEIVEQSVQAEMDDVIDVLARKKRCARGAHGPRRVRADWDRRARVARI
jgi:hypothetical protein